MEKSFISPLSNCRMCLEFGPIGHGVLQGEPKSE